MTVSKVVVRDSVQVNSTIKSILQLLDGYTVYEVLGILELCKTNVFPQYKEVQK